MTFQVFRSADVQSAHSTPLSSYSTDGQMPLPTVSLDECTKQMDEVSLSDHRDQALPNITGTSSHGEQQTDQASVTEWSLPDSEPIALVRPREVQVLQAKILSSLTDEVATINPNGSLSLASKKTKLTLLMTGMYIEPSASRKSVRFRRRARKSDKYTSNGLPASRDNAIHIDRPVDELTGIMKTMGVYDGRVIKPSSIAGKRRSVNLRNHGRWGALADIQQQKRLVASLNEAVMQDPGLQELEPTSDNALDAMMDISDLELQTITGNTSIDVDIDRYDGASDGKYGLGKLRKEGNWGPPVHKQKSFARLNSFGEIGFVEENVWEDLPCAGLTQCEE